MGNRIKLNIMGLAIFLVFIFLPQLASANPNTFNQKYRVFVNVRFAGSRKSTRVARFLPR